MKDVENIDKFNQFVESVIREDGTCEIVMQANKRIAVFEAETIWLDESDNSCDGFVGWWDDDHSQMTLGATPYEVYCDMP
jgi:hypothetical protein